MSDEEKKALSLERRDGRYEIRGKEIWNVD